MACDDTALAQGVAPPISRDKLPVRLARFPWWFVVILLIAVFTAFIVFTQANYNEAFNFIRAGLSVTITTTLSAFFIAIILGLVTGLGRIADNVFFRIWRLCMWK